MIQLSTEGKIKSLVSQIKGVISVGKIIDKFDLLDTLEELTNELEKNVDILKEK